MRAVSYFAPFLVALSLTPAIGAETAVDRAKEDEIVTVPKGDPDMEEAFRQARETPKGFLDLARAPRSTITSMAVKVAVHDGASCRCRSRHLAGFGELLLQCAGAVENLLNQAPDLKRSEADAQMTGLNEPRMPIQAECSGVSTHGWPHLTF